MNKRILFVNLITLIRVIGAFCLIPIYLYFGSFWLGVAVLLFISTDSIDGFLARTLHASTFFGAIFDALSDKLFNIVVISIVSFIEPKMLIVLILEIAILIISFNNAFKGNKTGTLLFGKLKMVILSISIVAILVLDGYPTLISLFSLPEFDTSIIINILSIINIVIDSITFVTYLVVYIINSINNKEIKDTIFNYKLKSKKEIKGMLFSNDFYIKNKNVAIKNLILNKKK